MRLPLLLLALALPLACALPAAACQPASPDGAGRARADAPLQIAIATPAGFDPRRPFDLDVDFGRRDLGPPLLVQLTIVYPTDSDCGPPERHPAGLAIVTGEAVHRLSVRLPPLSDWQVEGIHRGHFHLAAGLADGSRPPVVLRRAEVTQPQS